MPPATGRGCACFANAMHVVDGRRPHFQALEGAGGLRLAQCIRAAAAGPLHKWHLASAGHLAQAKP